MTELLTGLPRLREAFPAHQINVLPKQMRKDDQDKGKCVKGSKYSGDGKFCGGWHARSIHLDYVGHAALTDRFLDADPMWSWEPVAFDGQGLPAFDAQGGLWIRLTICGVTRLGYGDAQGKKGPNATKEAIGDALRNAGMRFGAALDLWHKGDLHDASVERGDGETAPTPEPEPEFDEDAHNSFMVSMDAAETIEALDAIARAVVAADMPEDSRGALRAEYDERRAALIGAVPA